jgi:Ca-activated chloride channel homolog
MLDVQLKTHRAFLFANREQQSLFTLLRLRPGFEAAANRPHLAVAFVVDTSGSMRDEVTSAAGGAERQTKLDVVIAALQAVFRDTDVAADRDRMALVHFNDAAEVVVPFTDARDRSALVSAASRLERYSGGTQMGAGMAVAMRLIATEEGSRRMVVLTDGQTFDEEVVREVAGEAVRHQVPLTVIGVGDDVNVALLTEIADRTQGRMMDIVPDVDQPQPPAIRASELPKHLLADVKRAADEVVTDVQLSVRTVKDVVVERITRVFPDLGEVDRSAAPYALGNAAADTDTIFIVEMTMPSRPPARFRIAQLGLTYRVAGAGLRGEHPPLDVVVEFTHDERLVSQVDPTVLDYVKQRNVDQLIRQAATEALSDPAKAAKTLEIARNLTVSLGNDAMTRVIDRAYGEVTDGKTISAGTGKTLLIAAKTLVVQPDAEADAAGPDA